MPTRKVPVSPCEKPTGWRGRIVLWFMNASHSKVTDWGLAHIAVQERDIILDVGCGGGRTLSKLAAAATRGKVWGVDYSPQSVATSRRYNAALAAQNRVGVILASISYLPFADNSFDLITAVETHFWWPDLTGDLRETFRVLKRGGRILLIAEIYRNAQSVSARLAEKHSGKIGFQLLTPEEHLNLLVNAGYSDIQIFTEPAKGWISAVGHKT